MAITDSQADYDRQLSYYREIVDAQRAEGCYRRMGDPPGTLYSPMGEGLVKAPSLPTPLPSARPQRATTPACYVDRWGDDNMA